MAGLDKLAGLPPAKLALTVRTLRERAGGIEVLNAEPIAVVGMACRLPGGVETPEAYWRMLVEGVDAITEVPADRWDVDALYDPDPATPGKTTSRWGGFLGGLDRFDPAFFGIAPREAASLDPQQRLVLEVAWEALERAGVPPRGLAGSATGMFLGIATLEYGETRKDRTRIDPYFGTGNNASVAAGRLSYLLGLTGPAIAVDTACSASLTAVHLACQSLRAGDCDLALAGGVNVILSPDGAIYFSKLGAMAADGRCKTFDAAADGYVRGEGCGLVVLKTLSRALADGDPVLALIRGSAINQDGRSNGLTAPNGRAQEAVIGRALDSAGVPAAAVGFVECHGTGTPLGDSIETAALARAYRPAGAAEGPLLLGAVKTHFGHLESAAGIAGLIKAILCLQHGQVPANLHFRVANPHVDWAGGRLAVPQGLTPWPVPGRRFAGVSAFGFSGSNAHVVLEEAGGLLPQAGTAEAGAALLVLSAEDRDTLADTASLWRDWLAAGAFGRSPASIAATAAQRRTRHACRLALTGRTADELAEALTAAMDRPEFGAPADEGLRLVMVFPGQGGQWAGMGLGLAALPEAGAALEACAEAFAPLVGWRLRDVLALDPARFDALPVDVVQPALFAIQIAVARQILAWGVPVDAVVGHSMGEVAAACIAGSLSLDDAARVICTRSRLIADLTRRAAGEVPAGAMAVVELPAGEAAAAIAPYGDRLSIAALNGPRTTLIAGRPEALAELIGGLEAAGCFARRIKVDYASHSQQMDPILQPLAVALGDLTPRTGSVSLRSTVTGGPIDGVRLDGAYWSANLRQPVRLWPVIADLAAARPTVFLEIGPHPVLVPALEEGLEGLVGPVRVAGTLRRDAPEPAQLLASLGRLVEWGIEPDWRALQGRHPVVPDLPTYPWRRSRYWLAEARPATGHVALGPVEHPLLGGRLDLPDPDDQGAYRSRLSADAPRWLGQHRVGGAVVLPATAYLDMALAAAGGGGVADVSLRRMMVIPADGDLPVHTSLRDAGAGRRRLAIHSRGAAGWLLHAEAVLASGPGAAEPDRAIAAIAARCPDEVPVADYYAAAAATGVDLGPAFRVLTDIRRGAGDVLARLSPAPEHAGAGYRIHPALLDGGLQALAIALLSGTGAPGPYVPVSVERVALCGPVAAAAWVHACRRSVGADAGTGQGSPADPRSAAGDVALLDEAGRVVAIMAGVRFQALDAGRDPDLADWLFRLDWQDLAAPVRHDPPGRWLLVGGGAMGAALAGALRRRGSSVVEAADPEAAARQIGSADDLAGIVLLVASGLDEVPDPLSVAGLMAIQRDGVGAFARLCRTIAEQGFGGRRVPRLWAVSACGPLHAAMAGLVRSAAQELPAASPGFVQLDGPPDVDCLAGWLAAEGRERQLRLTGSTMAGARFRRLDRAVATAIAGEPLAAVPPGPVLITGGLGGIGLVLAEALAAAGVAELLLVGRRPPDDAARGRLAALAAGGVTVTCVALDITDEAAVLALMARYAPRSVIHAAGVLDDVPLADLTPERLERVLAPKIAGAWALHRASLRHPLAAFVLMSSTAAVFGGPAQGNYAAANAFLDALATWRRAAGLPAISIGWSAWTDVGLAAASADRGARLAAQGIGGIGPARGAAILRRLLARPAEALAPEITVLPLDVDRWRRAYPEVAGDPLFADLIGGAAPPAPDAAGLRRGLSPGPDGRAALLAAIIAHLAAVTGRTAASITARTPLAGLGLDSLMALDVRNRLQREFDLVLSATLLWRCPTPEALVAHLLAELAPAPTPGVPPAPAAAPTLDRAAHAADGDDGLDRLPADDLARLLAAELERD